MYSFLILFLGAQPIITPNEGIKIVFETTRFENGKTTTWETTIMKLGKKLRIEETFPDSKKEVAPQIGEVIIWDGKECWLFTPLGKPQQIPPIRNGLEFLGFKGKEARPQVEEKGVKWDIDKANNVPLKKETSLGTTEYKDYTIIEGFGYFPSVIEKYSEGNLDMRTVVKNIDEEAELRGELFEPRKVLFSEKAKEEAKKYHFE